MIYSAEINLNFFSKKNIVIDKQSLNIYSIIANKQLPDNLLLNYSWKKADYYQFCSDSTYWGCCGVTKISKKEVATAAEAILYLLQCEREALKYPADRKLPTTVKDFFETAMADGQFTNPEGKLINTETFWENYKETINGIDEESSFQFLKNGREEPLIELLNKAEVISVTAYANEWNNKQYFIETTNAWLLFGWATLV